MTTWLKRIRAAAVIGLAWGVAWLAAGLVLLLIVGPDAADVPFPLGFGFIGFLAGFTFSAVLSLVERRRSFQQLSLPRFAGWGAAGGLLLSAIFAPIAGIPLSALVVLAPVLAVSGAACAAGSLALARKSADGRMVDGGAQLSELGLTEDEKRELLGRSG